MKNFMHDVIVATILSIIALPFTLFQKSYNDRHTATIILNLVSVFFYKTKIYKWMCVASAVCLVIYRFTPFYKEAQPINDMVFDGLKDAMSQKILETKSNSSLPKTPSLGVPSNLPADAGFAGRAE